MRRCVQCAAQAAPTLAAPSSDVVPLRQKRSESGGFNDVAPLVQRKGNKTGEFSGESGSKSPTDCLAQFVKPLIGQSFGRALVRPLRSLERGG